MHLRHADHEIGLAGEIRTLATWLSLAPFVLIFLIGIGQAGMASAQVPEQADTRSGAAADYKPWNPIVIYPVDEGIVDEVRMDQTRFPEIFEIPGTAQAGEPIEATATPVPASSATSAPSPHSAASPTPQPGATSTQPGAATPTATASWSQISTATRTATPAGTPSPAPTATWTPASTATRTSAPTATPTRTLMPTNTPTRTPAPTSSPTRASTPTYTPSPVPPTTSAPLGDTYWLYEDTSPYRYMMYPSPPSGERTTFATDLANGTVEFYTDLLPPSTSIQAGTTTVYINAYTPSLNPSYGVWRLFAGRAGSWTELGYGQMGLPFFTDTLLQVSFATSGYVFGTGEQLMLVLEADQFLEITWDGWSNTSRLELP